MKHKTCSKSGFFVWFFLFGVFVTQIDDFQQQVADLESRLYQKSHEVDVIQSELKLVKEFRRKRAQMQKDLDEVCVLMQYSILVTNAIEYGLVF